MAGGAAHDYGDRMFDDYRHISDDKGDGVTIGVEAIAEQVVRLNHGFHRMLCALVRFRLQRFPRCALALEIKAAIDKGYGA